MLASEIITAAMREGNTLEVGTLPTDVEMTENLSRLNGLIRGLFGHGISEELTDWQVPGTQRNAPVASSFPQVPSSIMQDAILMGGGTTYSDLGDDVWPYPPQCSRLVIGVTSSGVTVYLPEQPDDGSRIGIVSAPKHTADVTIDGNGRYINSATALVVSPGAAYAELLYRADKAAWVTMTDLALTDESPLPPEYDDLLICGLAIRLAPRLGFEPRAGTRETFSSMLSNLATRYSQTRRTVFNSDNVPNSRQSTSPSGSIF